MPWSLEIHHLGIGQGDSTLILAKEWDATDPNLLLRTRSALIDGGDWGASNVLIPYIRAKVSRLDVAVITHFDGDHYRGFTEMLEDGTKLIKHTRIYDQGRAAFDTVYEPQHADGKGAYWRYIRAIANAQGRRRHTLTRVTERVNSFFIMGLDGDRSYRKPQDEEFLVPDDLDDGAPVLPPDWLVGEEILWNGVAQPDGAPTILCIAANKWVLQADGETAFHSAVPTNLMIDDPEDDDDEPMSLPEPVESVNRSENADSNGKSLAFVVDFGGFRYYLGGDLEDAQETPLAEAVNEGDDDDGRVHAMKASHHGSGKSTTTPFVARMRPSAVFISSGRRNTHGHPTPRVVATLEAAPSVQRWYLTELPYRSPVETSLPATGYLGVSELAHARPLPLTCTPGHVPCNPHKGVVGYEWPRHGLECEPAWKHVVLTVSDAQANGAAPPHLFTVGVLRSVQWTLNTQTGATTFVPTWFTANHT